MNHLLIYSQQTNQQHIIIINHLAAFLGGITVSSGILDLIHSVACAIELWVLFLMFAEPIKSYFIKTPTNMP